MSNFNGNEPVAGQSASVADPQCASGPAEASLSLEQQIALLKEQLAQAEKLTALGELVSTTTHEFNNVLMTIINYAKMGIRHQDPQTHQKAFDKILQAGNRA